MRDGWVLGTLALLASLPGVRHAVSTRTGPDGASLAWDDPRAPSNRVSLARAVGAEELAVLHQVHGARVVDAARALAGAVEADAMFTGRPGVALMGLSADCPIVLLADVATGVLGMAHASWRSTVGGIVGALVRAMVDAAGCRPAEMVAGVCPSAGPCCYEVGQDTLSAARAGLGDSAGQFFRPRGDRLIFDLWAANVRQMLDAGICRHNIQVAGVCTICDERFFSVRREGSATGRFAALIARA